MPTTHRLTPTRAGIRLDRFLSEAVPELSRAYVKRLIDDGLVTVNGASAKPAQKLKSGDAVVLVVPDPEPLDLVAEAIPLHAVYEDEDLIVIDKQAGMSVHPGPGHPRSTLVNALLARCPDLKGIGGALRPGIVHRLDKDTSGLIIVAKNDAAHRGLTQQFKEREVEKTYQALAKGRIKRPQGRITGSLGRDPRNRKRMAVVAGGREAETKYQVLRQSARCAHVEVKPRTGRTHQIRAHFASIGHPLLGDTLYGERSPVIGRQALHAAGLRFRQPRTGMAVDIVAPLPADFQRALAAVFE